MNYGEPPPGIGQPDDDRPTEATANRLSKELTTGVRNAFSGEAYITTTGEGDGRSTLFSRNAYFRSGNNRLEVQHVTRDGEVPYGRPLQFTLFDDKGKIHIVVAHRSRQHDGGWMVAERLVPHRKRNEDKNPSSTFAAAYGIELGDPEEIVIKNPPSIETFEVIASVLRDGRQNIDIPAAEAVRDALTEGKLPEGRERLSDTETLRKVLPAMSADLVGTVTSVPVMVNKAISGQS